MFGRQNRILENQCRELELKIASLQEENQTLRNENIRLLASSEEAKNVLIENKLKNALTNKLKARWHK